MTDDVAEMGEKPEKKPKVNRRSAGERSRSDAIDMAILDRLSQADDEESLFGEISESR